MTVEIILLGLASSIRPSSLAAVYALLSATAPRRLMVAYVASGLVFTITFGLLVVGLLHGIGVHNGTDETKAIAEIVAGGVMLGFAVLVQRGRVGGPRADDAPGVPRAWRARLEHNLTLPKAALAGPATHVPGLFYLVALNVITTHHPGAFDAVVEIGLYNVIWFALALVALALCMIRPQTAHDLIEDVTRFASSHARAILLAVSAGAGTALLVRGLLAI